MAQGLFGKRAPGLCFLSRKTAIFADGCFWHGHDCRNTRPKNNEDFWQKKRERNIERDRQVTKLFENRGWTVIRIWECELKGNGLPEKLKTLLP